VEDLFSSLGLSFEFVTDGDITGFNAPLLLQYFVKDIQKRVGDGATSCALNHFFCYEKIVKNNDAMALIFEDDLFFLGDFKNQISSILKETSQIEPGFMISLENSTLEFPLRRNLKKGKLLYEATSQRCTGGYLIDLRGATNCLEHTKDVKCDRPIDIWHTSLIHKKILNMYWAHPPLIEQGSHNGLIVSTIGGTGKKFRRVRWLIEKYYKMYFRSFLNNLFSRESPVSGTRAQA
jgi:glycosyl transferase, family 25